MDGFGFLVGLRASPVELPVSCWATSRLPIFVWARWVRRVQSRGTAPVDRGEIPLADDWPLCITVASTTTPQPEPCAAAAASAVMNSRIPSDRLCTFPVTTREKVDAG